MHTVRTLSSICPHCKYVVDSASPLEGKTDPSKDDITLCIRCGEWSIFNSDLSLRKPTDEEFYQIGMNMNCRRAREAWIIVQDVKATKREMDKNA